MIRNQALNILYLKTGLVTALVAVVVGLQLDLEWAAHYAAAGLFGLVNWYLLGWMLIAWTQGNGFGALVAFCGKLGVLVVYAGMVLPLTGIQIFPFLMGFNMFLMIAILDSLGSLIADGRKNVRGERPLPRSLKALLTGRPNA